MGCLRLLETGALALILLVAQPIPFDFLWRAGEFTRCGKDGRAMHEKSRSLLPPPPRTRFRRRGNTPVCAILTDKALVLSVNSRARSDRDRALLSEVLGGMVGEPLVEMQTVEQLKASRVGTAPHMPDIPEEERRTIIHSSLDRHYRNLLDQPIPMLGNKSPRAATNTARGRVKVVDWLKMIENRTAASADRNNEMTSYSFDWLWAELALQS